jgi:hypothetical protein
MIMNSKLLGLAALCLLQIPVPALSAVYQVVELRILGEGAPEGTPVEAFKASDGTTLEITSAVFWTDAVGNVVPFGTPTLIALGTTASLAWEQGVVASYVVNDDANFVHPFLFPVLIGTIGDLPFALGVPPRDMDDDDHHHHHLIDDDHHLGDRWDHDPTAAVPEPSTWAMMLLGFAGLGFAFRRTRHKTAFA